MSNEEQSLAKFLLPNEVALFWTNDVTIHPQWQTTGGRIVDRKILTYEAGMYQDRDVSVLKTLSGKSAGQKLRGKTLLTDKRLLIINQAGRLVGKDLIYFELLYDAELIASLACLFAERNAPIIKKYYSEGLWSRNKMIMGELRQITISVDT
ncbi:MAG: hypothetical protein JRM82_03055, partial [Nitrososphaerota archaeon]|nr:hypothetical protein [Nitrososphaerota archaeon]